MADLKCIYIDYCTTYTVYWTSRLNKPDVSLCSRFLVWLLQQAIIPGFHPLSSIPDPRLLGNLFRACRSTIAEIAGI